MSRHVLNPGDDFIAGSGEATLHGNVSRPRLRMAHAGRSLKELGDEIVESSPILHLLQKGETKMTHIP